MLTDAFFDQLSVCDNDEEVLVSLIKKIDPSACESAFLEAVNNSFGGLVGLFNTKYSALSRNNAIGANLAEIIKYMQIILMRTMKEKIRHRDLISNMKQLNEYLLFRNLASNQERLIIFMLNSRNFLLREEIISVGTTNSVIFHPQTIIRTIIDGGASAFILVHNHPSGDPSPSLCDIEQTVELKKICDLLSITFHDHIIVGEFDTFSMRSNKIF